MAHQSLGAALLHTSQQLLRVDKHQQKDEVVLVLTCRHRTQCILRQIVFVKEVELQRQASAEHKTLTW